MPSGEDAVVGSRNRREAARRLAKTSAAFYDDFHQVSNRIMKSTQASGRLRSASTTGFDSADVRP